MLTPAPRRKRIFDNITESTELKESLIAAFVELDGYLTYHSGPFASNCVIGSKWRQMNDVDEFTKDGIKILRHLIVTENVSARFAVRLARFIGITVDRRCHDGTTTSMLLFCRLACLAARYIDADARGKSRYRWAKAMEAMLTQMITYIEALKVTEEELLALADAFKIKTTDADIRGAVAYHMAMISSKGDTDLSSKIAQVIRSAPKEIYNMFRESTLAVETPERYTIKEQKYDLALDANLGHSEHYNYKLNTQYRSDDCVLFITGNEINIDSAEGAFLLAFISQNPSYRANLQNDFGTEHGWEHYHENKRNLVIISKLLTDPKLIYAINEFNITNPTFKISWFDVQLHPRVRTTFNKAAHYIAGKPIFGEVIETDPTTSMIGLDHIRPSVHHIGHTLTLSHLYEKTKGEVFHPYYRDPEAFPPYTHFLGEIKDVIDFARSQITNQALDPQELNTFVELYRAITCQEIFDIEVGGSIHEQRSNQTVFEDAMGAALSAIQEGVVFGGYGHIAGYCHELSQTSTDPLVAELAAGMFDALISLLNDSMRVPAGTSAASQQIEKFITNHALSTKWHYIVANPEVDDTARTGQVKVDSLNKVTFKRFLDRKPGTPILIQAFGGYEEQLTRASVVLPMVANTATIADMRIEEGKDFS
jgi:hypothetical protein